MLPTLALPGSDLSVSTLCLGAAPFGTSVTGEALDRLFGTFLDAGGTFFDTAHCYCGWLPDGNGVSERTLGTIVRRFGVRDRVVLATKGGHPEIGPYYRRPERYLSPETIAGDVAESLVRLDTDVIDIFYLHRDDARVPAEEIIEWLNVEVRAGRVRALGASNWRVERIAAANAHAAAQGLHGFALSQPQFSLARFNHEPGPDPTLRSLAPVDLAWHAWTQLPVAAYSSTACGYFAGNTRENAVGQFDNPVSQARRERATQLATELGCTPNQVALAYLLGQPFPVIPILGTTNLDHLREAITAVEVKLTPVQLHWLTEG